MCRVWVIIVPWKRNNPLPLYCCLRTSSCQQSSTVECCHVNTRIRSLALFSSYFELLSSVWTYSCLHVKCPIVLSDFNQGRILSPAFHKSRQWQTSWKSIQWEARFTYWPADWWTDMTKLKGDFRYSCENAKNYRFWTKQWYKWKPQCT